MTPPATAAVGRRRLWRPALGVLTVSALLTAFSESFYWYAGGTDYPGRVLFYLIPTTALLWALASFPRRGWSAVMLVGAVYGFVTEGVLTAVVYGGYPFDPFAISYTALAWHALLAVGFGLFLLHRVLARGSLVRAAGTIALFGAFWGAWAITLRLPPDSDNEEVAGLSVLTGDVGVTTFALYTVAVTVAVGGCHLALGSVVRPADLVPGRGWSVLMLIVGGLWFALLIVPAAPWAPIELAVLLALCGVGLARLPTARPSGPPTSSHALLDVLTERIQPSRLLLLAVLPVAASLTFGLVVALKPSDDTVRAALLEPLVMLQALAGWAAFGWALRAVFRRPADGSPLTQLYRTPKY